MTWYYTFVEEVKDESNISRKPIFGSQVYQGPKSKASSSIKKYLSNHYESIKGWHCSQDKEEIKKYFDEAMNKN